MSVLHSIGIIMNTNENPKKNSSKEALIQERIEANKNLFHFGMSISNGVKHVVAFDSENDLFEWIGTDKSRQQIDESTAFRFLQNHFVRNETLDSGSSIPVSHHVENLGRSFSFDLDLFMGAAKKHFIDKISARNYEEASDFEKAFRCAIEDCQAKGKEEKITINFYFDDASEIPIAVISNDLGTHDYHKGRITEYMDFFAIKLGNAMDVFSENKEGMSESQINKGLGTLVNHSRATIQYAFKEGHGGIYRNRDYIISAFNQDVVDVLTHEKYSGTLIDRANIFEDWSRIYRIGLNANVKQLSDLYVSTSEYFLTKINNINDRLDDVLLSTLNQIAQEISRDSYPLQELFTSQASDKLLSFWSDNLNNYFIKEFKNYVDEEIEQRKLSSLNAIEPIDKEDYVVSKKSKTRKLRI